MMEKSESMEAFKLILCRDATAFLLGMKKKIVSTHIC